MLTLLSRNQSHQSLAVVSDDDVMTNDVMNNDVMVMVDMPVTSLSSASPLTSSVQEEKQSSVYPEEWRHVDQVTNLLI